MDHRLSTSLLALSLLGCFGSKDSSNQDSAPPADPLRADLLFVLDSSASMYDESGFLGLGLGAFADTLPAGADLHLAVTTVSADPRDDADGDGDIIEPGEVGTLVSGAAVISTSTSDWVAALQRVVLCEGTCWPAECSGSQTEDCVPHDPSYACGDDPGGTVSAEYLACLCGGGWVSPECGGGNEEGLESALLALCRAAESPPESCFDHTGSPLTEADSGTNAGFLRADTSTLVFIVSDEGDNSRALPQGDEDPHTYLSMFQELNDDLAIAVVGPNYDPEAHTFDCNSGGGTSWGTSRYIAAAQATGGFFTPIEACTAPNGSCSGDDASYCEVNDFSAVWPLLAELL
ncbi:MAG: hypothetical protein ABIO70_21470 [Pseudomonadota bacterium]